MHSMVIKGWLGTLAVLGLLGLGEARAGDFPYPVEKPAAGDIYHVATGVKLSPSGALDMLGGARLICVAESHDNMAAHQVQLEVIRGLEARRPGQLAIGMEMFRTPQQPVLDRYTRGEITELEFLKQSGWYGDWRSDFGYYREILRYAREHHLDVIALNPPRELQQKVSRQGLDALSEEERKSLPELGELDPYQKAMLEALFSGHMSTGRGLDAFVRVQVLWEESMASRVVEYLSGSRGQGKQLVILTGGWHVRYGFGVPKKVVRRVPMPYAVVLPDELPDARAKEDEEGMDVKLPEVPLLAGDLVWWVPFTPLETRLERAGFKASFKEGKLRVGEVRAKSPAAKGGLKADDVLLSAEGSPLTSLEELLLYLEGRGPGSPLLLVVQRGDKEKAITVVLPEAGKKP